MAPPNSKAISTHKRQECLSHQTTASTIHISTQNARTPDRREIDRRAICAGGQSPIHPSIVVFHLASSRFLSDRSSLSLSLSVAVLCACSVAPPCCVTSWRLDRTFLADRAPTDIHKQRNNTTELTTTTTTTQSSSFFSSTTPSLRKKERERHSNRNHGTD